MLYTIPPAARLGGRPGHRRHKPITQNYTARRLGLLRGAEMLEAAVATPQQLRRYEGTSRLSGKARDLGHGYPPARR